MNIAVFPGSFDPITLGHLDIIRRALPLFDKIIIGIGTNTTKKNLFSLEKREVWIKNIFKLEKKITVRHYMGLTVDFCKKMNAQYVLRGLRSSTDYEYETAIAQMNKSLSENIETIFIVSLPQFAHISSSIVREIIISGGNAKQFLPEEVLI